jgi:hypothetical protein
MVGHLVSWWRHREIPVTWRKLAALTQLELKDGEFVTRGDGQCNGVSSESCTASSGWLRVNVRTDTK